MDNILMDLMKAYNSVDCGFPLEMMRVNGISNQFIQWVKVCITSPMFSVAINRRLDVSFQVRGGKRGLRQEDPLSPYLFLLVMQGFTSLFHYTISAFHPRYKRRLNKTHLADDFLSLCAAEGRTFQISARGFD